MAQITAAVAASPGWTLLRWFGRRLAAALLHGGAESDTLGDRACRDTSLPNQRGRREGEYHDQMGVVLKSDAGNPKLAAALRWRPAKAVKQGNGDPVQLGGLCHSPPHAHAATGGGRSGTADIPCGRDTRSADHGGDGWTRRDETTVGTGKPKHQRTANRPTGNQPLAVTAAGRLLVATQFSPVLWCDHKGPVGCTGLLDASRPYPLRGPGGCGARWALRRWQAPPAARHYRNGVTTQRRADGARRQAAILHLLALARASPSCRLAPLPARCRLQPGRPFFARPCLPAGGSAVPAQRSTAAAHRWWLRAQQRHATASVMVHARCLSAGPGVS